MGGISPITKRAVYRFDQRFDNPESDVSGASEKRYGTEHGDASAGFLVRRGSDGDTFRNFSFSALGLPELRETIFRRLILEEISRTTVKLRKL
jgi:hypothetical protein